MISYYSKTVGGPEVRGVFSGKWNLSTIDSAGDVGRVQQPGAQPGDGAVGRGVRGHGARDVQVRRSGKERLELGAVDRSTQIGGGYISLAFNPVTKLPAFSYYDAYNANLKYATFNGSAWSSTTIASKGTIGLYTDLLFDSTGKADILYYNKGTDSVFSAAGSGGVWGLTQITTDGGRWISRAVTAGHDTFAYVKGDAIGVADL